MTPLRSRRASRWFPAICGAAAAVAMAALMAASPWRAPGRDSSTVRKAVQTSPGRLSAPGPGVAEAPSSPTPSSVALAMPQPRPSNFALPPRSAGERFPLETRETGETLVLASGERMERWRARYFCPADINRDDVVDSADLVAFTAGYVSPQSPPEHLDPEFLDLNADGWIDADDLLRFIDAWTGDSCDPEERRTYRGVIC